MNRFLILGFEYLDAIYYCLVRYKAQKEYSEYVVTVMNGELETLLHGNHVIKEKDGCLQLDSSENRMQNRLKEGVTKALGDLLGIPLQKVQTSG